MERFTKGDQAYALATATAKDFNDELTVILSSISILIGALDPEHPARPQALDLRDAAQRCAQKTRELLRYGSQRGGRVMRTSLGRLIEE